MWNSLLDSASVRESTFAAAEGEKCRRRAFAPTPRTSGRNSSTAIFDSAFSAPRVLTHRPNHPPDGSGFGVRGGAPDYPSASRLRAGFRARDGNGGVDLLEVYIVLEY